MADDQRPLSFPHALLVVAVSLLAGCASSGFTLPKIPGIEAHRMEIQQGNYVTQEMIAKLQPGMTRDQFMSLLSTEVQALWQRQLHRPAPDSLRSAVELVEAKQLGRSISFKSFGYVLNIAFQANSFRERLTHFTLN